MQPAVHQLKGCKRDTTFDFSRVRRRSFSRIQGSLPCRRQKRREDSVLVHVWWVAFLLVPAPITSRRSRKAGDL
eukprot:3936739-Rhodomonas_salina.2